MDGGCFSLPEEGGRCVCDIRRQNIEKEISGKDDYFD